MNIKLIYILLKKKILNKNFSQEKVLVIIKYL